MQEIKLLDCTFRDGGYYNNWHFSTELFSRYCKALSATGIVTCIEVGFRFAGKNRFLGSFAFSKDQFIQTLSIPDCFAVAVMVNGSDVIESEQEMRRLFPQCASDSPVDMVRIACHFTEIENVLPFAGWLKDRGYEIAINLMQIADRSAEEIWSVGRLVEALCPSVLYFADSTGSLKPSTIADIVKGLRVSWAGEIGIHTHDNMGLAASNTIAAINAGVTWVDATVSGMGRGPGNVSTEHLVLDLIRNDLLTEPLPIEHLGLLFDVAANEFRALKTEHNWGTNSFYYLSGLHGIHPSYVQFMLNDDRFDSADVLAMMSYLKEEPARKTFNSGLVTYGANWYTETGSGSWEPRQEFQNRSLVIVGSGNSALTYRDALLEYIRKSRPIVLLLNEGLVLPDDIEYWHVVCNPLKVIRFGTAVNKLRRVIAPISCTPARYKNLTLGEEQRDFGMGVKVDSFEFFQDSCIVPKPLSLAYALGIASSGQVKDVSFIGLDGYGSDDERSQEVQGLLNQYAATNCYTPACRSIGPSEYDLPIVSLYGEP